MTSACRFLSPGHGVPDVTVGCGGESEGRLSFNERETLSRCDALPNASAKILLLYETSNPHARVATYVADS